MRHTSLRPFGNEGAQRILQVRARVAAQATMAEERDLVAALSQQRIVDGNAAELVDHHGGGFAFRSFQKMTQQRRLAGAEKARDDGDRNARAAHALAPPSEWSRFAGREQLL